MGSIEEYKNYLKQQLSNQTDELMLPELSDYIKESQLIEGLIILSDDGLLYKTKQDLVRAKNRNKELNRLFNLKERTKEDMELFMDLTIPKKEKIYSIDEVLDILKVERAKVIYSSTEYFRIKIEIEKYCPKDLLIDFLCNLKELRIDPFE